MQVLTDIFLAFVAGLAGFLGAIHRDVGIGQQGRAVHAVRRIGADADARRQRDVGAAHGAVIAPGDGAVALIWLIGSYAIVFGVLLIGLGSGLYLAADLGAGPRDGLMTGLHHRFGWSIRRARTAIELVVLVMGFLMGGTVGLGTILFAFGIGPVVQFFLRIFDPEGRVSRRRRPDIIEELEGDSLMLLSLLESVRRKYGLSVELKTLGRHLMNKPANTIGQIVELTLAIVRHGDDIVSLEL